MAGARRGLIPIVALAGLVGLGWALGVMASEWLAGPLDGPVTRWVVDHRAGWLTSAMGDLTTLGAPSFILMVAVGVGLAWWARRATATPLVMLLMTWLGAEILFNVAKFLVDRARPPAAMATEHFDGLAFPSGHATQATAVWGMVALLVLFGVEGRAGRVAVGVAVLAVTVAVVVGMTRVYLGAHWASDVLGGWLLGGLWAGAVFWLVGPRVQPIGADRLAATAV